MDIVELAKNLPDEVVDLIVGQQDRIAELEKNQAAPAPVTPAPVADPNEAIAKALSTLPPEVSNLITSLSTRLEKAETELAGATEVISKGLNAQADQAFIAKAASWANVVDDPSEVGIALRKLTQVDAESAAVIEKALNAANSRAAYGAIFKELGYGAEGGEGDVESQVTTLAKSLQSADPDLSIEEARSRVYEQRPDLYEKRIAERPVH